MSNHPEKYVTETTYKKESHLVHKEFRRVHEEFGRVHKKFDRVHQEFDRVHEEFDRVHRKIDSSVERLALAILNTNDRLLKVETNMATKSDIDLILNRVDHLTKKVSLFEQEEGIQSVHLKEVAGSAKDHEKRLRRLEPPQ